MGERLTDAKAVRDERLRKKLERELGPTILEALADAAVLEVMVNGDGQVWCDRLGDGMALLPDRFSPERAESLVGTVASLLDSVANSQRPIVEGELPFFDFRFEGLVPPVVARASFDIRKHASQVFTFEDYLAKNQLCREHAALLQKSIDEKHNIVITGGTGSGKTTFVNALLHEKVSRGDPNQRFVLLEDTRELRCDAHNKVALRTCEATDLTRLVRATMRLRPDAIIVGEVRGREALLDMLKAWNTGHPGGICTVHANSARAALSRLDQLVQEAGVPSQPHLLG
ncbi:MAG: P-type conjugative transfer ATPase TrbB, partial [Acidobacteria bacterium]|nr:P-type conjugative transfer ATPase TrbB [Acidobacteriota bacterium]NIO58479.1 P-type conjugative transfer ATPase TrbB [Acidobacteriota bacterium]NIQ84738.1 P-type conjugative transfer ATPase TrbB [Acidobacteriota bacterium]